MGYQAWIVTWAVLVDQAIARWTCLMAWQWLGVPLGFWQTCDSGWGWSSDAASWVKGHSRILLCHHHTTFISAVQLQAIVSYCSMLSKCHDELVVIRLFWDGGRPEQEGVPEGQVPPVAVWLVLLSGLVSVCTLHRAVYYGCLCWSLHHSVHCHQYALHGHGAWRNEFFDDQHTQVWKLCKCSTVIFNLVCHSFISSFIHLFISWSFHYLPIYSIHDLSWAELGFCS